MNINNSKIQKLKQNIYNILDPIIDSDYSLIDIPDYNNIGDNLIWEGELDYLSRLKYKKLFESNCWIYQDQDLPQDGIILLQGGGNFGDLYPETQNLKLHLIENYTNRKIIIFPQSIHYNSIKNFRNDLLILKKHPNLHICVRDQESFDLLNSNGLKNIYLLPDMAFCIDLKKFNISSNLSNRKLLMKRKDKEFNMNSDIQEILNNVQEIDVLDWPTFNISKTRHRLEYRKEKYNRIISKKLIKLPVLKNLVDYRYGLKLTNQKDNYIKIGIEFLNQYDLIFTTRLHGVILAVLLGKEVRIIDNKHQKLSRYYNMWLKDFKNVEMYK